MKHILENYCIDEKEFLIVEQNNPKESITLTIKQERTILQEPPNEISIFLEKEQLRSFIGVLLHVQSKMK